VEMEGDPWSAESQQVELRLPADRGYVAALRAFVTALAAQSDLTVDEIEDLQIAVDEACALVLPHAAPGAQLLVNVELATASVGVVVSVPARPDAVPDRTGFSWTVLSAVADEMHVTSGGGTLAIRFSKRCDSLLR
jgi:serine/threonine-protein kinase RsbW